MKATYLFATSCLFLLIVGCSDPITMQELTVSSSSFNVRANEPDITLQINSMLKWSVTSNADWCKPDKMEGENSDTLTITLEPNTTQGARTAVLTVSDPQSTLKIEVTQRGEERYTFPIVFHVLYQDRNDSMQYVKEGWLPKIIDLCNEQYANKFNYSGEEKNGVDMNLEFILATTDPNGNKLEEPGVNRVVWPTAAMDCYAFMNAEKSPQAALVWDLNKYINVFLYTFSNRTYIGLAHLPYATTNRPLSGLLNGDHYFTHSPTYAHGISIDNTYIYTIDPYLDDVSITLSHELGHYLGLLHAFGVSGTVDNKFTHWKDNTDYCDDTPNYDREGYEKWLAGYLENTHPDSISTSDMVKRVSSTGESFIAHNMMDYYYSWSDEFTPDQRKRVRHVIEFSPLIPGFKERMPKTRSITNMEKPAIRTIE